MAIKYYVLGEGMPQLSARNLKNFCEKIEKFVTKTDDDTIKTIRDLCSNCFGPDDVTRDRIKGPTFAAETKQRALDFRVSKPPSE